MRVLVIGATGFVGRWLVRELEASGHVALPAPGSAELDVTDARAVALLVIAAQPDAIAHLAGVSHALDAARDPERAFAVNEGGTRAVIHAAAAQKIPVLVSGSSEVYGTPDPGDLPLTESAPLRADQPYGQSKLAQERAALEVSAAHGAPVVITRSFNHTGPGQRADFVAPALATRILHARAEGKLEVLVGALDVKRDIGDVRDVARAYRLLLESLSTSAIPSGTIVNVATGRAVSIREVFDLICEVVGTDMTQRVDPALLRANDPPVIVGDPGRLHGLTGWSSEIPLERTVRDLVESISAGQ